MREKMMNFNYVNKLKGGGAHRCFIDTLWRPFTAITARSLILVFFFFVSLLAGAFIATRYLNPSPVFNTIARPTMLGGELMDKTTHTQPDNRSTQRGNEVHNSAQQTILASQRSGEDTHTPPSNEIIQTSSEHQPISANQSLGNNTTPPKKSRETTNETPSRIEFPLNCKPDNTTQNCPTNYPRNFQVVHPPAVCPDYFRWIHEDLRPWSKTGITRDMVERARRTATFRLVIVDGKAYVERYRKPYETRDIFTLWGILQLLRKYPGRVPDLDLMFDCVDWPVIISKNFRGPKAPAPPPLFRYCGDDDSLDLPFPDWSFWGWPDINIKPWHIITKEIKQGNEKMKWAERAPYAYWKGNPFVCPTRMDLLKCNVSDKDDWHARIYIQDWFKEGREGFKESNLAAQCIHRYKIYIEGSAWSVSEKYILACDSLTLLVKPRYYDFFTRGLMPMQHYFPIKDDDKCRSIKHAVEWGESHQHKTQAIGKATSNFIQEDLKMEFVYDYMLHLLSGYAKLFKFKPTIPEGAEELCSETMACTAVGRHKEFMMDSMVRSPSNKAPCTMPPPYDPVSLLRLKRRKANTIGEVEKWEKDYWDNQTMHYAPSL